MDASEEYALQSKLLLEFTNVPSIDSAWVFKSKNEDRSTAMYSISQTNLLANNKRKYVLFSHIMRNDTNPMNFQWSPFPIQMDGVSIVVPSPSGSKLFVVRNGENGSPTKLEIVGQSHVDKEIHVAQSVHGPLYTDEWFHGISWNQEENFIAFIAEESPALKPAFDDNGYKREGYSEKDSNNWKGQGDWEEDWGETYSKKGRPSLFVLDIASVEVRAAKGISRSLSVGQVVWAPASSCGRQKYLVFVGWLEHNGFQNTPRKLGIKYCSNRPCSLYATLCPFEESDVDNAPVSDDKSESALVASNLTPSISSAFFPQFSKDGKLLVFLSANRAVNTGAHNATNSLQKINWPSEWKIDQHLEITDVVSIVMCPQDSGFPGLYCSSMIPDPWLSDQRTLILTSAWRSTEVILSVDVLSGNVTRISPENSVYSWSALAIDGRNVLAVSSSPIDPPQIKYGHQVSSKDQTCTWVWDEVNNPLMTANKKVKALLSYHEFSILKIPVSNPTDDLSDVMIAETHDIISLSSKKRGTPGFGEEALQSLPGKVGSQDVQDCLTALDYVIKEGLIDASKVAVVGISHGGFLTTHLIGQAPDRFMVAAARNPVCNLSLMLGTTDIPDWCYSVACGTQGRQYASESPSLDDLRLFYQKSPIAHISKVKAPLLMLLGGADLRVPASNGLQYARALRERGGDVRIMMFPEDIHEINIPQSDFESFLNIGVWFKKHLS
uniref:acylaminoacyl-peptidase n=1 Tax=Leersia perrieri TaxID=77586 RepID=A0A0D9XJQ9_9ORYZ